MSGGTEGGLSPHLLVFCREPATAPPSAPRLAIGIGLNVAGSGESIEAPQATTLEEQAGHAVSRAGVLQALLDRIDRELVAPDWEREIAAWEQASLHRPGDRMTIRREGGELTGEYIGLDPSGFLRLKTETGEAVLPAGEVAKW